MGSTEDPKDGQAVAGSIFTAVIVYAVGLHLHLSPIQCSRDVTGIPRFLRHTSISPSQTREARSDIVELDVGAGSGSYMEMNWHHGSNESLVLELWCSKILVDLH